MAERGTRSPSLTAQHKEFLLRGTHTGKLATVRADGRPHVVPIWFHLDGDSLVFTLWHKSVKALNMQRDARVCICVDDETPPFSFMQIEATVMMEDDLDSLVHWATIISARYMGADLAEQYGKRNGVPGELLVRVTPHKVVFEENVAD